jgi:hypothetical protein
MSGSDSVRIDIIRIDGDPISGLDSKSVDEKTEGIETAADYQ